MVRMPVIRKPVNFSLAEAAKVLGYDAMQVASLVARQRIRSYRFEGWTEPRVTVLDLWEYSIISGRVLNLK